MWCINVSIYNWNCAVNDPCSGSRPSRWKPRTGRKLRPLPRSPAMDGVWFCNPILPIRSTSQTCPVPAQPRWEPTFPMCGTVHGLAAEKCVEARHPFTRTLGIPRAKASAVTVWPEICPASSCTSRKIMRHWKHRGNHAGKRARGRRNRRG